MASTSFKFNCMRYFSFILIYGFFIGSAAGQNSLEKVLDRFNSHTVPYISVEELAMIQNTYNLIILDARERSEFDISHIPGSEYIGFTNFSLDSKVLRKIDTDVQIIVYCSIGIRSEKIGQKLQKAGYSQVKNLYGGIFEWKNKGFQVVDSTGKKTQNIHAFSKKWSEWLHAGNPIY